MYSRRVTKRPTGLEGVPDGWYRTTKPSWNSERLFRAVAILVLAALAGGVMAGEVLDDPTRPPGYRLRTPGKPGAGRGWHLSGIWIHEGRRLALINGRLVHPGQVVDGAKLVTVTPTAVRLRRGDRVLTLRLQRNIKQATTTARK